MDTAGTLCDYYRSDAMDKFRNSLITSISMFREMDMKMIGMIAIIGVGVVMGIWMLMR